MLYIPSLFASAFHGWCYTSLPPSPPTLIIPPFLASCKFLTYPTAYWNLVRVPHPHSPKKLKHFTEYKAHAFYYYEISQLSPHCTAVSVCAAFLFRLRRFGVRSERSERIKACVTTLAQNFHSSPRFTISRSFLSNNSCLRAALNSVVTVASHKLFEPLLSHSFAI
jgi:hypothetical protein